MQRRDNEIERVSRTVGGGSRGSNNPRDKVTSKYGIWSEMLRVSFLFGFSICCEEEVAVGLLAKCSINGRIRSSHLVLNIFLD
jgi:hypothetical protein